MARGVGSGGSFAMYQQPLLLPIHLVLLFLGCVVGHIIHLIHAQLQCDTDIMFVIASNKKGIWRCPYTCAIKVAEYMSMHSK